MPSSPAPFLSTSPGETRTSTARIWTGGFTALVLMMTALRLWYVYHLRIDQDEWQHLHTIWELTLGKVQYRDVFDNHMPLFHFVFTPLLKALGETSHVVEWMRLTMVPIFALALWLVYLLGRTVYDARTGAWAALCTGLCPIFLFTGTEFRPDLSWTAAWLAALLILMGGRVSALRCFAGGFFLGVALGISLKTSLLTGSFLVAWIMTLMATGAKVAPGKVLAYGTALVAGWVIVPGCIAAHFAMIGAWQAFCEGVWWHNVHLAKDPSKWHHLRKLVFVPGLVLTWWRTAKVYASAPNTAVAFRRALLVAVGGVYFSALFGFWTVLSNEDYLPGLATFMPAIVAYFLTSTWKKVSPIAVLAAVELGVAMLARPPWRLGFHHHEREYLRQVLAATDPSDSVMDETGESIFRTRPFYYIMETLSRAALLDGRLPDTIAQDMIQHGTCVAHASKHYPPAAQAFLDENFLQADQLFVAGHTFNASNEEQKPQELRLNVVIPATYAVFGPKSEFHGQVDGTPYTGPRALTAGPHVITTTGAEHKVMVAWAKAVERGVFTAPPLPDR